MSKRFTILLLFVVVKIVVSHIQRIGCQLENLLYTAANFARGLLNTEKKNIKRKSGSVPPHPPTIK